MIAAFLCVQIFVEAVYQMDRIAASFYSSAPTQGCGQR
jgi:hypothetical protein